MLLCSPGYREYVMYEAASPAAELDPSVIFVFSGHDYGAPHSTQPFPFHESLRRKNGYIWACTKVYMHEHFCTCFIKKNFFCGSGKKIFLQRD